VGAAAANEVLRILETEISSRPAPSRGERLKALLADRLAGNPNVGEIAAAG